MRYFGIDKTLPKITGWLQGFCAPLAIPAAINNLKLLLLISFLFATLCSVGQINDGDAFFEGTYSKNYIKKHGILTVIVTGSIGKYKASTDIYYFDNHGFLKKQVIVDSNGNEQSKFVFKFNKYGDLIERIRLPYQHYKADTFVAKKVYKGNNLIKESSTYSPLVSQHIYNKRGDRIRTVHPYNNGNIPLSSRIIDYDYDKTGKLIHVTDGVYSGDLDIIEKWMSDRTIIYKKNKIIKIVEKIPSDDVSLNRGNLKYSYDSLGNLISIESDAATSYYYSYYPNGLLKSKSGKFHNEFEDSSDSKIIKIIDEYTYTFRK